MRQDDTETRHDASCRTPLRRAQRDAAIFADRASGMSWAEVARRHGVSLRQAQRRYAVADRGAEAAPTAVSGEVVQPVPVDALDVDALGELVALIETQRRAAVRLEALAEAEGTPPRVRVAATAELVNVVERRIRALQLMGLVPRRLSFRAEGQQNQQMLQAFAEILRRHDVPDEALRDLQELAQHQQELAAGRFSVSPVAA